MHFATLAINVGNVVVWFWIISGILSGEESGDETEKGKKVDIGARANGTHFKMSTILIFPQYPW